MSWCTCLVVKVKHVSECQIFLNTYWYLDLKQIQLLPLDVNSLNWPFQVAECQESTKGGRTVNDSVWKFVSCSIPVSAE